MDTQNVPPERLRRGDIGLLAAVVVLFLAAAVSGTLTLSHTRSSLEKLSEKYFKDASRMMTREVQDRLEPAGPILNECLSLARRGVLPVDAPGRLEDALVELLRSRERLGWLTYSDQATGRFVAARRIKGGAIVLHRSSPDVNGGRPEEFVVHPDGTRRKRKPKKKNPYDPRSQAFYQKAIGSEGLAWTAPYRFFGGGTGISAVRAYRLPGLDAPKGVFSVAFYLRDLSRDLAAFAREHDAAGSHFILERHNQRIVASTEQPPQQDSPLLAAALKAMPRAMKGSSRDHAAGFTFNFQQQPYLASVKSFTLAGGLEWTTVCLSPQASFLGSTLEQGGWTGAWALILLLLALGLGGVLAFRKGIFAFRLLRKSERAARAGESGPVVIPSPSEGERSTGDDPTAHEKPGNGAALRHRTTPVSLDDCLKFELDGARRLKICDGGNMCRPVQLALAVEDLSDEILLSPAPRIEIGERQAPALSGIPLLAKLGAGAMGSVYYGIHPRLGKEVAVKVLLSWISQKHPDMIQRFVREAQMAAQVQSPHLVAVFDINEEKGLFFQVMEFVRGPSAAEYRDAIQDSGKRGVDEDVALEIGICVARALAAAHAHHIIHRDVKPENILLPLDENGLLGFTKAKLTDLGIARSREYETSLTETHSSIGTPGFLAPEQAMNAKNSGKPADIFGAGATLFALLSGHPPFEGSSPIATLLQSINESPQPIRELCPTLSEPTAVLIERCLEKDPEARYADGAALLEALLACRASLGKPAKGSAPHLA